MGFVLRGRIIILFCILFSTLLIGEFLFYNGFFPKNVGLKGSASRENIPPSVTWDGSEEGELSSGLSSSYSRIVIMVIDGFRADFLWNKDSPMHFTKSLVESKKAKGFTSVASPPTVTLPRIKALMSGGLPSFTDFIYNFFSNQLTEDSLPLQMHQNGKKVVFYGDDTWIKLFPNLFHRYEGTTSFFVTDTVEVDNNVTRHLSDELSSTDWDVLILHYLGLDHIGHLSGINSPLMKPKQKEMDVIIERIYKAVVSQSNYPPFNQWAYSDIPSFENITIKTPTLFVVCSDHGMTETGNHGGSSNGETESLLLFMSPYFNEVEIGDQNHEKDTHPKVVSQIDLVPTLSLLFSLPIPLNSMGCLIPELFPSSTHKPLEFLRALEINCMQLINILKSHPIFWDKTNNAPTSKIASIMRDFEIAQDLHGSAALLPSKRSHFAEEATELYLKFMREVGKEFSRLLTNYDDYLIFAGMFHFGVAFCGFLLFLLVFLSHKARENVGYLFGFKTWALSAFFYSIFFTIHLSICARTSSEFCSSDYFEFSAVVWLFCAISFVASIELMFCVNGWFGYRNRQDPVTSIFGTEDSLFQILSIRCLLVGLFIHLISLSGSSFIEEEHQTWYFLTTTLLYLRTAAVVMDFGDKKDKRNNIIRYVIMLLCLRLLRSWNQTGVKWQDPTTNVKPQDFIDIAKWLSKPTIINHTARLIFSWSSVIIPFLVAHKIVNRERFYMGESLAKAFRYLSALCSLLIMAYKWDLWTHQLSNGVWVARLAFLCIFSMLFIALGYPLLKSENDEEVVNDIRKIQSLDTVSTITRMLSISPPLILICFTYCFTLIHKTHNMFPFLLMGIIAYCFIHIHKTDENPREDKTININLKSIFINIIELTWIGNCTYFSLGNSNSLSTIDISGAYTGLSSYNPLIVGTLTFLIGYSGPLFFLVVNLVYFARISRFQNPRQSHARKSFALFMLIYCVTKATLRSIEVLVFSGITVIMQNHLFLWSVFSPKLIYEIFWTAFLFIECTVCLGAAVYILAINYFLERRKGLGKRNK